MFSKLYFAVASALSAKDALRPVQNVLEGKITEAVAACASLTDAQPRPVKSGHETWQLYGDLQLMIGREQEAQDSYRTMQKAVRHSRDEMRIASCRSAAWRAFFHDRFGSALAGFTRIVNETDATQVQRLGAHLGALLSLHQIGHVDGVYQHLGELGRLAGEIDDPRWGALVDALRRDLLLHYSLRCDGEFADHAYWRSVLADVSLSTLGETAAQVSDAVAGQIPMLTARIAYQRDLHSFAAGQHSAIEDVDRHMRWSLRAGLVDYYRALCVDVSLAAIAAGAPRVAETMLDQCRGDRNTFHHERRAYVDYLYCISKVKQKQGRSLEAIEVFSQYALLAMQHIRGDVAALSAHGCMLIQSRPGVAASDDVSTRLPAKYRRAYRYLMDNLERRDLSVREIAASLGVTERALQAAFKSSLGVSPRELIRRKRMERIRDQLLSDGEPPGSALEVASKWGVQHRSTLLSGYRKEFQEAPSDTLARR
jgi:AraC-like DNA-binding protein